ncbi:FAD binding domain protein [Podospora appendiculata]|uniref:FAD binding domain protein n=1 Tax=Podospora appendiculata TaxID=314037 RepID=A0AAE0WZ62_9PEZI|nr:FAD binding domain protein [Podospora appendiculata]
MPETNGQKPFFALGDPHEFDPEKWSSPSNTLLLPTRAPPTNTKVLIIGAGFAGLTAALECWRKGHTVVGILDRNAGPNYSGDLIIIQPSALAVLRHWPQMARELEDDKVTAGTWYYRHDGELIDGPATPGFNSPESVAERGDGFPYVGAVQIRKRFYVMLLRMVARVGLRVEYGMRVERYWEREDGAGVALVGGEERTGDVVVAADGFRSPSELLIAGEYAPTQSSGMSVYRTAYPAHLAMANDAVRARWQGKHTYEFWMGAGMHIGLYLSDDIVAFGFTPRDEFLDADKVAHESWDPDVDPAEVIEVLRRAKGGDGNGANFWHPVIEALVRTAPRGNLIHWPLLWRNLRREWVSTTGRVVQIGDAAHSTVPSSAAGGTLALEDAITLASCLQLGTVPMATRIYNLLRYERASCTQKMAFVNAQTLSATTNWEAMKKDPTKVHLRYPKWLFRHDPETYVYEKYGQAFAHLVEGAAFQNTNIPPGHRFVHWTLEEIHEQIAKGKRVEDLLDGDWS